MLLLVRRGLQFRFANGSPPLAKRSAPLFRGNVEQMRSLARQLRAWLDEGVIEPSSSASDVLGLLFPVPKPHSDKLRWVLDSRLLNQHLLRPRFRLEGIAEIRHMLNRGDFMASIDIKDAFLQVPVDPHHRRYLAFHALGRQFRFKRMSFGTCVAPFTFTALLKPVLAHLHQLGFRATAYLDDLLLVGATFEETQAAVRTTVQLLTELGLPINTEKSCLVPTQRLEHLGLLFDTERFTISVPRPKLKAIAKDARRLLRLDESSGVTARQLAGFVGKVTAAAPAMRRAADFHRHAVQRCQHYALRFHKQQWDLPVHLSASAARDLRWWASYSPLGFNGTPIRLPEPDLTLTTDASPTGFGAVLTLPDGSEITTHGFWTSAEAARSSNWRETTALTRGLFSFASRIRRARVLRIETDNTTALSILRRFGSRHRHLGLAAEPLLRAVLRWRVHLQPLHIPGVRNVLADRLSRITPPRNEWALSRLAFNMICSELATPTIDWFASAANHQVARYASLRPDPHATFVNAFAVSWEGELGLFVPPLNLLSRVLSRIQDTGASGIVVAPFWPTRPWFPLLLSMSRGLVHLPEGSMVPVPFAHHPMRDQRAPPLLAVLV